MSQSSVKRHPSGQIPARHRELSDQVLKRYREKCVATKSLTALANVVEACDFLENQGLEITVAAVGGFCGGRPGSTIRCGLSTTFSITIRALQSLARPQANSKARSDDAEKSVG